MENLSEEEKFILNRIKEIGYANIWDWEEEKLFADFIKDDEASELYKELLHSDGITSILIGIYKYSLPTKRIINKRRKLLNSLINKKLIRSYWSGTGNGGYYSFGMKRCKTYIIL